LQLGARDGVEPATLSRRTALVLQALLTFLFDLLDAAIALGGRSSVRLSSTPTSVRRSCSSTFSSGVALLEDCRPFIDGPIATIRLYAAFDR
jgi:hypothetical protein